MPIEPDVGFAFVGDDGKLVIQSKSIGLHLHLYMIAPGLGVEPENLIMIQNPAGGTFGYKFSPTMEALVGAAALATGRPVFLATTTSSSRPTPASGLRSSSMLAWPPTKTASFSVWKATGPSIMVPTPSSAIC